MHRNRIVWSSITERTAMYSISVCITTVCIPCSQWHFVVHVYYSDADMHIVRIHIPMYYTCCIIYYIPSALSSNIECLALFHLYTLLLCIILLVAKFCRLIPIRIKPYPLEHFLIHWILRHWMHFKLTGRHITNTKIMWCILAPHVL